MEFKFSKENLSNEEYEYITSKFHTETHLLNDPLKLQTAYILGFKYDENNSNWVNPSFLKQIEEKNKITSKIDALDEITYDKYLSIILKIFYNHVTPYDSISIQEIQKQLFSLDYQPDDISLICEIIKKYFLKIVYSRHQSNYGYMQPETYSQIYEYLCKKYNENNKSLRKINVERNKRKEKKFYKKLDKPRLRIT